MPNDKQLSSQSEVIQATIAERAKVYGDVTMSHENIGMGWTGLIQQHYQIRLDHPIPAWLVQLMMTSFKLQRSALVFHADNFVDAHAYLQFAEKDQRTAFTNNTTPTPTTHA